MADTPDEKLVKLQQENERLKTELAAKPKLDAKDPEPEDHTPTPTQAELDAIKSGEHMQAAGGKQGYVTRQTKSA